MQTEKCGMENHEWKTRNGKTGSGKPCLPFWWRESSETVLGFLSRNLSPKTKDLPTNHVPDDSKCALHKINSAYFAHHVLFRLSNT